MQKIEEEIAHLVRMVEDLSDVVARQEGEIAQLQARVKLLMEREAQLETGVVVGDRPPPHW